MGTYPLESFLDTESASLSLGFIGPLVPLSISRRTVSLRTFGRICHWPLFSFFDPTATSTYHTKQESEYWRTTPPSGILRPDS
jgi:hypothetical protein